MQVQGGETDFVTACVSVWINCKFSNNKDKNRFAVASEMEFILYQAQKWTLYTRAFMIPYSKVASTSCFIPNLQVKEMGSE